MADWLSSMQQTFEYYEVDHNTWKDKRKLDTIRKCSISRDSTAETLGSASFTITQSFGECYIRIYLITIQNGVTEKHPLGTFLAQTPSSSFDGKTSMVTMDAYTPLLELKEKQPPLGYSILKGDNIMDNAYKITRENLRAPVAKTSSSDTIPGDFVANTSDTWLTFLTDFIANAKYVFGLDELGRVLYLPKQETASLQPVWTFDDSNSSILYPNIETEHDIYGIPNVVEVIYSDEHDTYYAKVVNDDENSPTSTVRRGREIPYRITNPQFSGIPTQEMIDDYANRFLKEVSSVEYTVTFRHGYCPVRLYDCVRLNYVAAGLIDIKAKIISQTINCEPGCQVTAKAVFTAKLWR